MGDFVQGGGEREMCSGCGARIWQDGLACESCGTLRFDDAGTLELASRLRRLVAYLIDALVAGIGVVVVVWFLTAEQVENEDGMTTPEFSRTDELLIAVALLGVAIPIWLWVARRGQSPGMRVLNLYTHRTSGERASAQRMIARDLWPYGLNLLFALIALALDDAVQNVTSTVGLALIVAQVVNAASVLWHRDRRALHDLACDTVVVQRSPRVLGVPINLSQHGRPSPPGELPPDR